MTAHSSFVSYAPSFVHLRAHSGYSILNGMATPKQLVQAAVRCSMPALALTDLNYLFGIIKFYVAALEGGIKPLLGLDVAIVPTTGSTAQQSCTLLAMNGNGYRQLLKISSLGALNSSGARPQFSYEMIANHSSDLILLSGGDSGWLGEALLQGDTTKMAEALAFYGRYFPDRCYIEIERSGTNSAEERLYIERALHCADQYRLPIVATNPVLFVAKDEADAHQVRIAIHKKKRWDDLGEDPSLHRYFCTPEEMSQKFSDLPAALQNTLLIAERCTIELSLHAPKLPTFPMVPAHQTTENYLEELASRGLQALWKQRGEVSSPNITWNDYTQRLQYELQVISSMGFAGYFLIVMEFIQWAKEAGIPVGPGRGSGSGSLVAYALGITGLDPMPLGLLFERFLNPNRISLPDFDIDFCMEGRDAVIEHVRNRYGKTRVAQIVTFGTLAAKAAIRDVGRVLGLGYGFVDTIAKWVPTEVGITLDRALEKEPLLQQAYETEEEVRQLLDMARKVEGVIRQIGKHAGGVVIAPTELMEMLPLCRDMEGETQLTQFDMKDVEQVGLVKFDFLGLRTLTIIAWAVQLINEGKGEEGRLEISQIPLDDRKAFSYLQQAETVALFQLESQGMRDLVRRLQPDSFEDLIALVSLFRPGPQHELLRPILAPTYGIILYQEQVMQVAQVLADYSLGEADLLRRAMGKKQSKEMEKQRGRFREGAMRKGISAELSMHLFDLVEKFAGYGFNKSHSAGYALLVYQTVWLKCHYPAAYMSAAMNAELENTDRLADLIADSKRHGLVIEGPSIQKSHTGFSLQQGNIRYGLAAIKGVGRQAADHLVALRDQEGGFTSIDHFFSLIHPKRITKRVLESLIKSGSLDSFGWHRAELLSRLTECLRAGEQARAHRSSQQGDLFSSEQEGCTLVPSAGRLHWSLRQQLFHEAEAFGFYWNQHPSELYREEIRRYASHVIEGLQAPFTGSLRVRVGGWVASVKKILTKRGRRYRLLTLVEKACSIEVVIFEEDQSIEEACLQPQQMLLVEGEAKWNDFAKKVRIRPSALKTWVTVRSAALHGIIIVLCKKRLISRTLEECSIAIEPFRGGSVSLYFVYVEGVAGCQMQAGASWKVVPEEELLERLRAICGEDRVHVWFRR